MDISLSPLDVGDLSGVAALLVAIVAGVIAGLAKREARRAADAAEDSATSSKRSADAAEEQTNLARAQDDRYDPMWELSMLPAEGLGAMRLAVTNRTGETAYGATVSGEGVGSSSPADVLDGSPVEFDFKPPRGRLEGCEVEVRWRRPEYRGSTEQVWLGGLSSLL